MQSGVFADNSFLQGATQTLVEAVPAVGRTRFDDFVERLAFRFAVTNRFARAQAAADHFRDQMPSAVDARNQPLAHDVANGVGQAITKLLFVAALEETK